MAVVKVKPTSAGRRAVVKVVNAHLHKGRPVAALIEKLGLVRQAITPAHIVARCVHLLTADAQTVAREMCEHPFPLPDAVMPR